MLASGFAGLGYQIIWTQQCGVWLGHEAAAVLAVVAAFFAGLSLGALWLGSRVESSRRPARWYAGCELVIGVWSALLALLLPRYGAWALELTGAQPSPLRQWSVAFAATFVVLLPATLAMGVTLPAMERLTASAHDPRRSIAALYASNTLGAVLGVVLSAGYLIAKLGLTRSSLVCAALNLLCAASTSLGFPAESEKAGSSRSRTRHVSRPLMTLACSGLFGIGYEVLVVRVLSQVTENTVYTFAALLTVYLLCSAAGAAAYERFRRARPDARGLGERLLSALAAACLCGLGSLWGAAATTAWAREALGAGTASAVVAEGVPALLAFGLPTLLMGACFSHFCEEARAHGASFGLAVGSNTLGAALAPALFGVLLAPALGPKLALLLIPLGYLALCSRRSWGRPRLLVPAAVLVLLTLLAPPLAFVELPEGSRIVSYEDGTLAAVSVVEDAAGVARLRINNRAQEGSSATQRVDGRQAWLPLLLHPAPERALFLGLGTGVTASFASRDSQLHVDAVELLPEVIRAARLFAPAVADGGALPRLHLLAADARRYVRASQQSYDVIVADNFHPARSGSGSLYTLEHFAAVRERLRPHGIFCQWLPLHQLDSTTLKSIVKTFVTAYPTGWALIASGSLETPVLGLVGRRDGARFDRELLRARRARLAEPEVPTSLGLEDDLAVLGSFVAGPDSLRRFAGQAELNTDDHPVVTYSAPSVTYLPDSTAAERFIALLHELSITPAELLAPGTDVAWSERLAAYGTARNLFIESGRNVHPSARVDEMLAQVQKPLLAVLRISPDFRPAYDPLVTMARALAGSNVAEARRLLYELSELQPARADASQLLGVLASAPAADGGKTH
jgi:spermidine synthase